MDKHHKRSLQLTSIAVVAALAFAGCGLDDDSEAGGGSGSTSGSITVSGSSTVEPISAAVAEKFSGQNPDVQISVDGPGTGDGFELFCEGKTDISDASRPIDTEDEVPLCEENGVDFIELKVGIDGIAVLTSPANEAVECLSFPDLYALLGPQSDGFDKWSDANTLGKKAGGSGDYPDAPLEVTAPGEESGTFDSFAEIVMEDIAVEVMSQPEDGPFILSDYQASGDDNVIIQGISGSDTSLGWVGFAFYVNNRDSVKALAVEEEEGGGCVEPTEETIASTEYPISRSLYIYVNAAKAEEGSAVDAYVDYYLSDEGIQSVSEVGYVSLEQEVLEETRSVWEDRETGTREG